MGINQKKVLLKGEEVWKEYPTGKNISLQVLKGVQIEVREGEMVVIVGPSGSGKSTLLHLLSGLDRVTSGKVIFDEMEISTFAEEQLAEFRNGKLGFVFQFHHLLSEFTALENVAMPALIKGESLKTASVRAMELLREVGVQDRSDHKPNGLSGGEQQRVAVARALMNNPRLIIADEPSGNLDEQNGTKLHELLVELTQKRGLTFVVATHNPDLAKRADRVLQLVDGKLVTGVRAAG
ncbi:MAG: ABC transporter ATP-binding protein [Ignavibacteriales bacterium]|nr:ABC transporter ATP-binding protein [Ignavibacteriales bacterium]